MRINAGFVVLFRGRCLACSDPKHDDPRYDLRGGKTIHELGYEWREVVLRLEAIKREALGWKEKWG